MTAEDALTDRVMMLRAAVRAAIRSIRNGHGELAAEMLVLALDADNLELTESRKRGGAKREPHTEND